MGLLINTVAAAGSDRARLDGGRAAGRGGSRHRRGPRAPADADGRDPEPGRAAGGHPADRQPGDVRPAAVAGPGWPRAGRPGGRPGGPVAVLPAVGVRLRRGRAAARPDLGRPALRRRLGGADAGPVAGDSGRVRGRPAGRWPSCRWAPTPRRSCAGSGTPTRPSYPREASVPELFAAQVARRPDAPAVESGGRRAGATPS